MSSPGHEPDRSAALVGILVLNYYHPVETLSCVRSLLEREPSTTRIFWIENDADRTSAGAFAVLEASGLPFQLLDPSTSALPPAGVIGVLLNPENLGYAGGNNVGLRLLDRLAVPFAWVLNNDTRLVHGNSEALVEAARTRPEVGIWGTTILAEHHGPSPEIVTYMGGILSLRDFSISLTADPAVLESNPLSFVSGCSLFAATGFLASLGFIPDTYFLYYEDPALTLEVRRRGFLASGVPAIQIDHLESLSTGRRSPLMEFYNRRNRWFFIQRYFPEELGAQKRGMAYRIQKWVFRGRFDAIWVEYQAYQDFRKGLTGRTERLFSRKPLR